MNSDKGEQKSLKIQFKKQQIELQKSLKKNLITFGSVRSTQPTTPITVEFSLASSKIQSVCQSCNKNN